MSSDCKVSVHIVTYNQARFVGQTLDSVLMQQVPWKYEIVIGDDCSSDGTSDILKGYMRRHGELLRPIFRERNLGPGPNAIDTLERCRGEYIAFLEGDDYWIDPEKLRLQAEYLDRNPDCALVHHAVNHILWPGGTNLGEYPARRFRTTQPEGRLLAMVNYIQTCSVMFRRACLPPLDAEFRELKIGDWPLFVLLSQNGWLGYIDRPMASYRIHETNNWNSRSTTYKSKAMQAMAWYLVDRVKQANRTFWQDTLLALAFKDMVLATRETLLSDAFTKLKYFLKLSIRFRKPFWAVTSLWPYYRANYIGKPKVPSPTKLPKYYPSVAAS